MGTATFLSCLHIASLMAPETGDIQIQCEPGVKVFLDGEFRGQTTAEQEGLVIQKVSAGRHRLRLVWKDSSTQEGDIEVVAGQVNPIMTGKVGQILVKAEPGVKVFLDGLFVGETDAANGSLSIPAVPIGPHRIRAVKDGHPPREETLEIKEGRTNYLVKPFGPGSGAGRSPGQEGGAIAEAPGERENSLGMRLRLIPPGELELDLPEGSVGKEADTLKALPRKATAKTPRKPRARISKPFEISACEVKMSEFEKVLGRKPKAAATDFRLERLGKPLADLPAMSVSWEEAAEFCRKLSELPEEKAAGTRYRLPTEAEWALARRTAGSPFPCFTWAERKIPKSIWELCSNYHDAAYYDDMPLLDPQGPSRGSRRVARLAHGDASSPFGWSTFRVAAESRHVEDWVRKQGDAEARQKALQERQKALEEGSRKPSPIERGLRWLARHQDPDGRWSSMHFNSHCPEKEKCSGPAASDYDVGLTGLALLAFLGRKTPASDYVFEDARNPGVTLSFNDAVKNGLRWLAALQDQEGCFPQQRDHFMYDHAMATQAMVRGSMLPGLEVYRSHAQRGIDFLVKAQNPGYAWRYTVRPGDNDTSVTGWCVMALSSAELSGLSFPGSAYEGVRRWLDRATSSDTQLVGYESPGDVGSVILGINDKWQNHPVMTAVGLLSRILMDKQRGDPWLKTAAQAILKDLPRWDVKKKSIDFYYWYYAAQALYRHDGPNGPAWKAFHRSLRDAVVPFQEVQRAGCPDGSWNAGVDKWGVPGGRVYATAILVLTLEAAEGSKD